jgi:hypothetical protein
MSCVSEVPAVMTRLRTRDICTQWTRTCPPRGPALRPGSTSRSPVCRRWTPVLADQLSADPICRRYLASHEPGVAFVSSQPSQNKSQKSVYTVPEERRGHRSSTNSMISMYFPRNYRIKPASRLIMGPTTYPESSLNVLCRGHLGETHPIIC